MTEVTQLSNPWCQQKSQLILSFRKLLKFKRLLLIVACKYNLCVGVCVCVGGKVVCVYLVKGVSVGAEHFPDFKIA